jgi:hypothetical protein
MQSHENHTLYGGSPLQDFLRHGGQEFFEFIRSRSAAGAPCFGAAVFIVLDEEKSSNSRIIIEYYVFIRKFFLL